MGNQHYTHDAEVGLEGGSMGDSIEFTMLPAALVAAPISLVIPPMTPPMPWSVEELVDELADVVEVDEGSVDWEVPSLFGSLSPLRGDNIV